MAVSIHIAMWKMVLGLVLLFLRFDGASSACEPPPGLTTWSPYNMWIGSGDGSDISECCPPSNIRVESSICLSECFDWQTAFAEQDSKLSSTIELLETFGTNFGDLRTDFNTQVEGLNIMTSQIQSQIDLQNDAEQGIDEQIEVLTSVRDVLENNSLSLTLTLDEIESTEAANMEEEIENQDNLTDTCQETSLNYTRRLSAHFTGLDDFFAILNTTTILTSEEATGGLETASELYDALMAAVTTENNGQVKKLEQLSTKAKDVGRLVEGLNKNCPVGSDEDEEMIHCCADVYQAAKAAGETPTDGIYKIPLGGEEVSVYCDMTTDGGGWTVFQRRVSDEVTFERGWEDYENGFGDLNGNFWMGLAMLYNKTMSMNYVLRIELEAFDGTTAFITYDGFGVSDARRKYLINYRARIGGTVESSLGTNKPFTTIDQDNDKNEGNCAVIRGGGGWWYNNKCGQSGLNGPYVGDPGQTSKYQGIMWKTFLGTNQSLKFTEMKCRPETFTP